jgi:L-amino acid N-acyltransferase YncA/RimJ/RimL family protein N-acetyltransferase
MNISDMGYTLDKSRTGPQKSAFESMKTVYLRPSEPERDFGQIAALISSLETELTTENGLKEYYEEQKEQSLRMMVAEDAQGELLGFHWAIASTIEEGRVYFYLMVRPEQRGQGVGSRLYQDLTQAAEESQAKKLRVNIRDDCPDSRLYAERRGFTEWLHQIAMALDLAVFDDRPYEEVIARLEAEGFRFTTMEALGNTEEAQRKLFILNDTTSITELGGDGEHSWVSFEDFQKRVCQSDWYRPGGQIVAIDTATGTWVAMSAITRFEGNDYAYNLFTGVDMRYRGRKLGQGVKVLALRYARDVLKVNLVRTHHNTLNLPMIAIDRKFGYSQMPGTFLMEKNLK